MVSKEKPTPEEIAGSAAPLRMSYEDYLEWAGEDTWSEWVNGEVIVFMPPKTLHQTLVEFLSTLLNLFARFFELGTVITGPFEMKATPQGSSREPDILFLARENASRLTPERLAGPADLVVEVVSTDSVQRDRADKFEEYEEVGIREYWIIDPRPRRRRADFYQLDAQGKYQPIPVDKDGVYRSAVLPGFWLRIDWLWTEELPDPLMTFAEVAEFSPETAKALEAMKHRK